MNVMKGVQKSGGVAVYLDAERGIDKTFAVKASKVNPKKMVVLYPNTINNAFHKINSTITKIRENKDYDGKPICIVVDSLAALPSDEEFSELSVDMENASDAEIKAAGARLVSQPGSIAKSVSKHLRTCMGFVADNDATVIFINQIRQKIGVLYGSPDTSAAGGMSLKFYCSTRLELKSMTEIKEKGSDSVKGINTKFKLTKSRYSPPRQTVEPVKLMFRSGIDPFGGMLGGLLYAERIKSCGAGTYEVLEPWAPAGVTFRASKEKGLVPIDILLSHPKLVDADSADQIREYISIHGDSINDGEGDSFEQVATDEEE